MILSQLSLQQVTARLAGSGLRLVLGPFNVRIQTRLQELAKQIFVLYANHELADDDIAEIHARVIARRFIGRPFSLAAQCLLDGQSVLPAVPVGEALDLLERSIKLAVVTRTQHLMLFRAATLERNGSVLLMPGSGPSGKTTLAAALVQRDYRLLSDEFGILDLRSRQFLPMPTALSLSRESLQAIRELTPAMAVESATADLSGVSTVYLAPPRKSVELAANAASARWVVFPTWSAPAEITAETSQLKPLTSGETFLRLASRSHNYEVLGGAGFSAVAQLVRACTGYSLNYSDLASALTVLNELTDAD